MKKRILLISAGGTIASMPSSDGLIPQMNSKIIGIFKFYKTQF